VSSELPSREQALKLLQKHKCRSNVVAHCKAVAKVAVETALACQRKGLQVDVKLVETGALLHDIGRSKTHSVNHVVVGAEIARAEGLPETVVAIIQRHVGGGITAIEAETLGWPRGDYVPLTLEEKIVSYADKLVETSDRVPIQLTIDRLREERLDSAADRVQKLNEEISDLIGETP
jgi:uncharacterized protein